MIELLVVIAIIGVLAATVMASLNDVRASSRDAARLAQIRNIQIALESYYNHHMEYPDEQTYTSSTGLFANNCGGSNDWSQLIEDHMRSYISSAAKDPLHPNNPWPYCFMYKRGDYHLCPPAGQGYTILFVSEKTIFGGLKLYGVQGEGNPPVAARYCVHP